MVRGANIARMVADRIRSGKQAGRPPEKVEDLVAFVPGRTPGGGAKDGVSLTRMIWLPYIWVVERTVAFFRGGWVKSYKVQRVALVVLCLTAALSNYNNKALFESEKQEKEERIDAYRVDARNLEAQEARLRAGVLVTAPRVPQRYAGARDELLRIARGEP